MRFEWRRPLVGLIAAAALVQGADAILILESVWQKSKYDLAKDLAAETQFSAVIDLHADVEKDMRGSGVWIGNANGHGYVLTAAHNFCDDKLEEWAFMTTELNAHKGIKVTVHPAYVCNSFSRMGYDLAIVELEDEVDATAATLPTLYDGDNELDRTLTFVGYGVRGTGVQGYIEGADQVPAAAESKIVAIAVAPAEMPSDPEAEAGNFLVTEFVGEDGIVDEETKEKAMPVSDKQGALDVGDSGGPAFVQIDGKWFVAGINESGTGEKYGDTSHFVRVAGCKDWILSVFPGATFGHEGE